MPSERFFHKVFKNRSYFLKYVILRIAKLSPKLSTWDTLYKFHKMHIYVVSCPTHTKNLELYLSLGDEIFCGIQIWSEKELRLDSVPGGTKATHTMGHGIRLLAGMKKKHYRELDIIKG